MSGPTDKSTDSIGGAKQPSSKKMRFTNSAKGVRRYTERFHQTFQHYIGGSDKGIADVSEKLLYAAASSAANAQKCWRINNRLHVVPYYNLGASIAPQQWQKLQHRAGRIRVKKLGFKIKGLEVMEETAVTRSSTLVVENRFESRPKLQMFVDHEHKFDLYAGTLPDASSGDSARQAGAVIGTFGANGATTTVTVPHVPSFTAGLNQANSGASLTSPIPGDFDDGELNQAAWYIPLWQKPTAADDAEFVGKEPTGQLDTIAVAFEAHNVLNNNELDENDEYEHTWENPAVEWHACQWSEFQWQDVNSEGATNVWYGTAPSWPATRLDALRMTYHMDLAAMTRDLKTQRTNMSNWYNSGNPNETVDQHAADSDSYRPQMHYLRLDPIYTKLGNMKLNARLWVEYFSELEIEEWDFPAYQQLETITSRTLNNGMQRPKWNLNCMGWNTVGAVKTERYADAV